MSGGFLPSEPSEPIQNPTPSPAPEQVQVIPRSQAEAPAAQATPEVEDIYVAEERKAREEMASSKEAETAIFEQAKEDAPTTQVQQASAAPAAPVEVKPEPVVQKDIVDVEVGKILEDNLVTYFQQLPPEAQARFKQKGEEVNSKIAKMVRSYKVKVKEALHLIRDWLLTIPGVNKFFLEQEAKIKTDRILAYEEEFHKSKAS